jgi:hypothetical protein
MEEFTIASNYIGEDKSKKGKKKYTKKKKTTTEIIPEEYADNEDESKSMEITSGRNKFLTDVSLNNSYDQKDDVTVKSGSDLNAGDEEDYFMISTKVKKTKTKKKKKK